MKLPMYLDCNSVHNYLASKYGLTAFSVYETTTLGDSHWFRGQCCKGCSEGVEIVWDREEIFHYYEMEVPIVFYKNKDIE